MGSISLIITFSTHIPDMLLYHGTEDTPHGVSQEQHVYSQISPRTRDGQKRQHVNHDYVDIEQMTTPVGSLESTMTEYYPMASNVFTPIQMTNPSSLSEITAMAAATQPTNPRRSSNLHRKRSASVGPIHCQNNSKASNNESWERKVAYQHRPRHQTHQNDQHKLIQQRGNRPKKTVFTKSIKLEQATKWYFKIPLLVATVVVAVIVTVKVFDYVNQESFVEEISFRQKTPEFMNMVSEAADLNGIPKIQCCRKVRVSSTGVAVQLYSFMFGLYKQLPSSKQKTYRKIGSQQFLTRPGQNISSGQSYTWGVNSNPQQTWGWIRAMEAADCPHEVKHWRVWNGQKWIRDPSLTVVCSKNL